MVKNHEVNLQCNSLEWSTRETEFHLSRHFNISYGEGENMGVLYNYCDRPEINIIHCR